MKGIKVLIVDNDPMVTESLALIVEKSEHNVIRLREFRSRIGALRRKIDVARSELENASVLYEKYANLMPIIEGQRRKIAFLA